MRGRKPKTTAQKKLEGNPGKRPLNKWEPSAGKRPPMPRNLPKRAQRFWKELVDQLEKAGTLDRLDELMIETIARTRDEYLTLSAKIGKHGVTYESRGRDGSVTIKPRPEVAMMNRARMYLAKAACEYGLTPVSRTRLGEEHIPAGVAAPELPGEEGELKTIITGTWGSA